MADQPVEEQSSEAPAKKGPGVMSLVKALAIVLVIVLAQVGAAAMLLPSPDETREVGRKFVGADHGKEQAHHEDAHADDGHHEGDAHGTGGHGETSREVNLGAYHIVSFNPKTGQSLSVDFELFGTVLAEEEAEFAHLYAAHEKRISEQITIAVRGLQASDFTDPGLGLIKRIILEKTNRALGKPLVREAVISQFSFIER
jgi:flagellar FliL protein